MAIETPPPFREEEQLNYLINGNFDFWQRGTSAATLGATNTYRSDRFYGYNNTGSTVTLGRSTDVPTTLQSNVVSIYSAELVITVPTSPTSAQRMFFAQGIEGQLFQKMVGRTVTLSFWKKSHVTGTFPVSIVGINGGVFRSYVTTYVVSTPNTWVKYSVQFKITDPTTSFASDNAVGAYIIWGLSTGSNFSTITPNTWVAGDFETTAGAALATSAAGSIKFSQVMLNIGTTVSTFTPHGKYYGGELVACQRYCYAITNEPVTMGQYVANSTGSGVLYFPVIMRVAPLIVNPSILDKNNNSASTYSAGSSTHPAAIFIQVSNAASPQNTYGSITFTGIMDAEI